MTRQKDRSARPDRPGTAGIPGGMAAMAVAMLLLPVGDAFAKLLTGAMPPLEVALWRLASQVLWLLPVAVLLRGRFRGRMLSPVVALSGLLMATTLFGLITAFAVMPIATAIAIFFVEPLLLTLLAGPLLGEVPGPKRLIAVGVGLVGALIVIRPSFAAFGPAALFPLLAALAYALNMILLRRASATRSALTIQMGASIYAALAMAVLVGGLVAAGRLEMAIPALPGWEWAAILGAGATATAAFVLIAEAFRRAEASSLAPLQYLEIVGATAVGYLVFGEFPDRVTWLGVAIILGSGLYVYRRERQQDRDVGRRVGP
ncbi:DMT family transporter [Rhodovulum euryhalinum]|uniref:Threonine/homoserine efflux transporter RhtA n=1 Tax=Rhodovulum euryhalinum TaxID=35805 RepID=A0A4R2KV35_9RHOB|nr:DMT family transporter [Rhodovulum euryhalinum]TCO74058.1 threonine/homoserine efflux transporter RhtA [Rhodovulum euryhalinum]